MTVLKLDLKSSAWKLTSTGMWQGGCDRKGVYVMSHPYEPAQENVSCKIAQRIALSEGIPEGGSAWLRFYCSDGYVGCDRRNPEVGYDVENDPECRFRRALIDGHGVWEADVAGHNPPSAERFYMCEITSHVNGTEVDVALEVADTQSTTNRFATDVYWALTELVICGPDEQPGDWGPDNVAKPDLVAPPEAPVEPVGRASVSISVPNDLSVALSGAPVTSGIPFPQGHLTADQNVRLIDSEGQETPLQTETLCRWPDGSVRWLLLDFQTDALPESRVAYQLAYGTEVNTSTQSGIVISEDGDRIAVDTGRMKATFSAQSAAILARLTGTDDADVAFENPLLSLENFYGFPPARYSNRPPTTLQVETAGPLRTVVKAEGEYEPLSGGDGSFTYILRFHFYADRADVKIEHTFVNTTPPAAEADANGMVERSRSSATLQTPSTALRTISLHLPVPGKDGLRYASATDADALSGDLEGIYEARLIQSAPGACRLFECPSNGAQGDRERMTDAVLKAEGIHAAGWADLSATGAGLTVAVRDCWQQYPKAFRLSKRGLDVDLWSSERIPSVLGSDPPFNCMQGESKTHEILLCLHAGGDVSAQMAAEAFQDRPRAEASTEWACDSLAFGPIPPMDAARFPAYEATMTALNVERMGHGGGSWWNKIVTAGGEDPETYDRYGMENWGDNPLIWGYQTKYRMWSNCEYDLAHTAFQQDLRSGDAAYFRRAVKAALHVRDVDTIHYSTVMPETVGGPHHHWIHHCVSPPNSGHVWSEGLVEHYWLTGDKRSLEVAMRLGDFLIRLVDRGSHRGAERSAGWPLIALMGVYKATLDDRYLQAAKKLVDDVVAWQDPVRGVWGTSISEQPAYEGGTTFMVVILSRGLIRYYEVTGDARVAHAVVRAADWVLDEAVKTPAGEPPQAFYKQTPHCSHISLIQPEALAYVYALTGDETYGEVARMALRENLKRWTHGVPTSTMRDMPRVLQILGKEG